MVYFKVCNKIKKDPTASLVYKIDGEVKPLYEVNISNETTTPKLEWKTKLLLFIYIATFLTMIGGVVFLDWWTTEMSALFLGSAILDCSNRPDERKSFYP